MLALDAGAEDFAEEEDSFESLTKPEDFSAVREALEKEGVPMAEAEITMIPQNYVTLSDENDIKFLNRTLDQMCIRDRINLDAVAYNFRNMKENLNPETQMIAVVKTDGYGHGAVPIAQMVQEYPYVWGFATATIEEALILRKEGVKKPILILGFVFPDAYEDVVRLSLIHILSHPVQKRTSMDK